VERQLQELGARIDLRAAGVDRYQTARLVLEWIFARLEEEGAPPDFEIVLVSGVAFPDGLAAGPYAFTQAALVMLTTPDRLHPDARAVIERGARSVTIVGGSQAVWEQEVAGIVPVRRIAGRDRTETAALVADEVLNDVYAGARDVPSVGIARGDDFPDALAAGIWAGYMGGQPLLLASSPDQLGEATRGWLQRHAEMIDQVVVFGGTAAISEAVFADARAAAQVTR
jgi:putative cell wall-binding protein